MNNDILKVKAEHQLWHGWDRWKVLKLLWDSIRFDVNKLEKHKEK